MSVRPLQRAKRLSRRRYRGVKLVARALRHGSGSVDLSLTHHDRLSFPLPFTKGLRRGSVVSINWAAVLPERMAPSMVAGSPVAVQSPARTRLFHFVGSQGRLCSFSGRRLTE